MITARDSRRRRLRWLPAGTALLTLLWLSGCGPSVNARAETGATPASTTIPAAHAATAGRLAEAAAAYKKGDYATALADYRLLAAQGVAEAQFGLGGLYASGCGVRRDYAAAALWWRKAADQNDADAKTGLGFLYMAGRGVPQDFADAASWFSKAAAQGDATAQYYLGELYSAGDGVRRDDVIAYALLTLCSTNARSRFADQATQAREHIMSGMTTQQIARGRDLTKRLMQPGAFLKVLHEASAGS